MGWAGAIGGVVLVLAGGARAAPVDRVEAVQGRAWLKRGAVAVAPIVAGAFDDPFVWRGAAGLRLTAWPRSLVGFSLSAQVEGQTPSGTARVAQRELRARLRPASSGWLALASVEVAAADGKVAFGDGILPFELVLRAGAGACGVDAVTAGPALAISAALGVRWFPTAGLGVETTLAWRTASVARVVGARDLQAADTVVSLELAIPFVVAGGS